jgi:nucleotide-binding universal stress UspA family protein
MNGTDTKVVVGVGEEDLGAALDLAAAEAVRAGCPLHLVHAVHLVPTSAAVMTMLPELEDRGRALLEAASVRAEEIVQGAVPVVTELVRGAPAAALVEAGRDARMVVLAHRHLSRTARMVDRSVSSGVAAHLRVPVVAVPTGWSKSGAAVVVAGVDVPDRAEEVLRTAVAEARARGAALRVVHTFDVPSVYEDLLVSSGEVRRWEERGRAEICAALDRLGDESVATRTEVVVRSGRAADLLVEESARADLLVIGRHDPLLPVGSHIGPVARAVLRESGCPVLLATPHHLERRAAQLSASGRHGY